MRAGFTQHAGHDGRKRTRRREKPAARLVIPRPPGRVADIISDEQTRASQHMVRKWSALGRLQSKRPRESY